jgi:hypothetical protein
VKGGQGADLNVLLSSKQQLINAILEGNTRPIDPPPDIPEDDKILQSKSLPKMWQDILNDRPANEAYEEYYTLIKGQCAPWILEDEEFMKYLLSPKCLRVFAEPLDGKGIQGIPPLKLQFDPDMPPVHRASCRRYRCEIVPNTLERPLSLYNRQCQFSSIRLLRCSFLT